MKAKKKSKHSDVYANGVIMDAFELYINIHFYNFFLNVANSVTVNFNLTIRDQ